MDDRRGRGDDAMRQRTFASSQERVFDGGGSSGGPAPALTFGGEFDQGSSYMALLSAGVNPQPPPLQWAVEEETTPPAAINLVPQSFSMANYTLSSSYQHPASFAAATPLGYTTQPYPPLYLQQADLPPPPQWPPRAAMMPAASSQLLPPNFSFLPTAPHSQQHTLQPRAAAALFGAGAPAAVIEQPAKDGYSWRKYGQKQLKDAESPRSYYKCTRDACPVKKVVERSFDGFITEITYKGRHNHPRPPQRGNAGDVPARVADQEAVLLDDPSDDEDEDDVLHDDHDGEDKGRAIMGAPGQRVVKKPKIILQTPSDVDLLEDGYRWRKYGQKVVKGNPRPRSYYKCTADNCNVRKQIERASTDPRCVLTTYTGRHNHDPPGRGTEAVAGGSRMFQQTGDTRRLKEES